MAPSPLPGSVLLALGLIASTTAGAAEPGDNEREPHEAGTDDTGETGETETETPLDTAYDACLCVDPCYEAQGVLLLAPILMVAGARRRRDDERDSVIDRVVESLPAELAERLRKP